MRHILLFFVFAGFFLVNCGPSAEDKAKEQAKFDSIQADSVRKVHEDALVATSQGATLASNINLNTKTPSDKKMIKTADLKFKVNNVVHSTEKIEDLAVKYGGYLVSSDLRNNNENERSSRISRDSILVSKQIVVVNHIQLRVPNERLDSFIRELSPLVIFFDHRSILLSDVTLQFLANQNKTARLQKYDQRQTKHIDTKPSKLAETTNAEGGLLDRQNQADELKLKSLELEDQVKYCNLTIDIYQKPLIIKDVVADFEYVSNAKPSFISRIGDAMVQGWWILEEIILFFVKIWGVLFLALLTYLGVKYASVLLRKPKK